MRIEDFSRNPDAASHCNNPNSREPTWDKGQTGTRDRDKGQTGMALT